ncbi:MAG: hypothetical protein KAY32_14945 [Candidatus Eisenbacteria sp.]|nr:hypothetical protein [Candidatus Eisenbacteria bacterium]
MDCKRAGAIQGVREVLRRGYFVLLCSALMGMLAPGAAGAGEEVIVDGVPHIKNGASPSQGVEILELEELWSVGGEDDEDVVLGIVVQAIADDAGNIYLLDLQLSQVLVFSPDGEMIGTLSREGEGPGETRRPSDMVFLPDSTLALLQTFPGKLVKVTLDDTPAGEITFGGAATEGGFVAVVDAKCRGGNLVVAGTDITMGERQGQQTRTGFLAHFGLDGTEQVRYWENPLELDFANLKIDERDQYNLFPRRWAIDADGKVYAAVARDELRIHVFAPDGTLERVIEKEFTNRKRTQEERELYEGLVEVQTRQLPGAEIKLAETPEAVSEVTVAADGNIWVLTSHGDTDQPEGIMATYDVFDPEGHFIKQVRIACDGDGRDDGLVRVGDDRVILIRGLLPAIMGMQSGGALGGDEEAAPMEIVCYRVGS